MGRRSPKALAVALLCLLVLAAGSLAMTSANYRLGWYVPLTSAGGGTTSSANYVANTTIGQTVIGSPSSASYEAGLGYWQGLIDSVNYYIYMPFVQK